MTEFRFLLSAFLILTFSMGVLAQDEEAAEKQNRMLKLAGQILQDAPNLKLPENRAIVYAQIGNKLWEADEKRARGLFQDSINELITAQGEIAEGQNKNSYAWQSLLYGQTPRSNILNLLGIRDAEFALEAMRKSRPAKLTEVLSRAVSNDSFTKGHSSYQHFATSELQLERRLTIMAADQNPARAIELLRESLKTGVSYETFNYLKKIHQKDEATANQFTEEVVKKILDLDLDNYQNYNIALYFLQEVGREKSENNKSLEISEGTVRQLADSISSFLLDAGPAHSLDANSIGYKTLERLFPGRAARILEKQKQLMQQTQNRENQAYNTLMQSNPSIEEMVSQADKMPNYRSSIYSSVANKLSSSGDISRAVSVFTRNLPADEADVYLSNFYSSVATQEISKGNFDEAGSLIYQITLPERRFQSLIYLATRIYQKNPEENGSWALNILNQADSLVPDSPEDRAAMSNAIILASTYAQIEPSTAFQLLGSLIPLLNDYAKASAKVSQFRNEGRVRKGEFMITMGVDATGEFNLGHVLSRLKETDLDQTIQLIDGFEQFETRIGFKLQIMDIGAGSGSVRVNHVIIGSRRGGSFH